MDTGNGNAVYNDIAGHIEDAVNTNEYGWAEFKCHGGSVSVCVEQ